jgi:2-oxo-3-hexenedioate decarboxylase
MPTPAGLDLDALASEMLAAQDAANQIEPFTSRLPEFDLPAAYEVARRIHLARLERGARAVGRKIGFTNPAMWARFGVSEPIWGYLYDTTVVRLEGTRADCSLGRFAEPKVEPEIVLHFRAAPPPGSGIAEVVNAVDWVAHGFEIVQSHYPGWRFQAPDTVADASLHAALLVGPPCPIEALGRDPAAALESFALTLSCGGREIETGKGSNVLGGPFAALAHLVSVLARQGNRVPLQAGEIVTTGTITGAQPVRPGETWCSELEDVPLPGLAVEFVA